MHGIVEDIILFTLQEIIVEIIIAQSYLIIFIEPSKCFTCLSVFFLASFLKYFLIFKLSFLYASGFPAKNYST